MSSETFSLDNLVYDLVGPDDLQDAYNIEIAGFPADEAGSLETFRYRQSQAPDLFLGAYLPSSTPTKRTLIAYINGTLSPSLTLTHESMSTHIPTSTSVCIHGVCVHPSYLRQGIATALLKEYLHRLAVANDTSRGKTVYERVLLIAHEEMRGLYEGAGFEWAGKSEVIHGSQPWYEMRWIVPSIQLLASSVLPEPALEPPSSVSQADIWAALQQGTSRKNRPEGKLLASCAGGIEGVVKKDEQGGRVNEYDLLCPRKDCGSIIIKKGVGKLEERESVLMEPPERTNPLLPALPTLPIKTYWWLVGPNPMVFENIGFSKPVNTASNKPRKLLACAECDLGPLGWCEDGTSEFWLASGRGALVFVSAHRVTLSGHVSTPVCTLRSTRSHLKFRCLSYQFAALLQVLSIVLCNSLTSLSQVNTEETTENTSSSIVISSGAPYMRLARKDELDEFADLVTTALINDSLL
ncbi:hypothetical protein EW146_g4318 [Bondarzewia mesenterica]|uniref:N-acetyltransferase domain-containing protein n=1 Tax=Bondarzewia mesenterica TaxID=1095465 RepID=A0A4V3XF68_9AGAM|nr:hypothetical protein EW146_g4318 [Bondarzewia mesenterica]